MIIVFLFLSLFLLVACIISVIVLSTLKIKVENLKVLLEQGRKGEIIDTKLQIKIELFLFKKMKWFTVQLDKEKIKKIFRKAKHIPNVNLEKWIKQEAKREKIPKIVEKLKIELEKLNLQIAVGIAEDAPLTSLLVGGIASFLGIFIGKMQKSKNCHFLVQPVYIGKDILNISLDSIICIKMVHIIYNIYLLKKGRKKKDERTSNRKFNEYSYERD